MWQRFFREAVGQQHHNDSPAPSMCRQREAAAVQEGEMRGKGRVCHSAAAHRAIRTVNRSGYSPKGQEWKE